MPKTWLEQRTRKSPAWWMATIQRQIAKASRKSKDPKHDQTDVKKWLTEIVRIVVNDFPPDNTKFDENMGAAAILSQVLAMWYLRCHRAKILDPRRPLSHRQEAQERWLAYVAGLAALAVDDREDAAFFPGQEWRLPFDPDATSGDFV